MRVSEPLPTLRPPPVRLQFLPIVGAFAAGLLAGLVVRISWYALTSRS